MKNNIYTNVQNKYHKLIFVHCSKKLILNYDAYFKFYFTNILYKYNTFLKIKIN